MPFYRLLGVAPSASAQELRAAYLARARQLHPDKDGSAGAEERFKALSEAYTVLSDRQRRAEYDRGRASGWPC
jgi:DnaJ-class molecular chaperone